MAEDPVNPAEPEQIDTDEPQRVQEQKARPKEEETPRGEDTSLGEGYSGSASYTTNTENAKQAIGDNASFNEIHNVYGIDAAQLEQILQRFFPNSGPRQASERWRRYGNKRAVGGDADDETTAGAKPLPPDDQALSKWYYYELNDYDQCFVQAMAVFDGASVYNVTDATKKLYAPVRKLALEWKGNSLTDEQYAPRGDADQGPQSERLINTRTRRRHTVTGDRYLWQDTKANGVSQFKLRVLDFLAEEAPGWFRSTFLDQLERWAMYLRDGNQYSALQALGMIHWHHREKLEGIAHVWARDDENWYRAAYLLEGAYEADRAKYKANANNEKTSPVLQIVRAWAKPGLSAPRVNQGCAAALTYSLLGYYVPQLALKNLDALLELPRANNEETGIAEDLYEVIVLSHLDLAVWHLREVLQHLAEQVDHLCHHRLQLTEMKLEEREHHRLQRQLKVVAAFDTFFRLAALSLAQTAHRDWVTYDLTQALPTAPFFTDKYEKEVLLAGILVQDESAWRSSMSTILCATMIERLGDMAFVLLRYWADLVLKDQSAYPDRVRQSYVQFMIEVATLAQAWRRHLDDLDFRSAPVADIFRRKLGQWLAEGQRRNLPIGALAQEILEQLPF